MKKRFAILAAAFALLAFLAIPMGMRGQTLEDVTLSNGTFSTDHITWTCANGNISITQLKGTSTNAVNSNYISAPRLYKGHILSFEGSNDYTITNISITYTGNYMGNSMTAGTVISDNVVTDNTTDVDRTWATTTNGGVHQISSVSEDGLPAIHIQNVASSTNVQLRPTAISVTYIGSGTTPTTYTVTYDCNGGTSGCPENVTGITSGTSITLAAAPTKTDYTFDGWNDGTTTYQAGASYTVNGNVTMTAQWTEVVSGDEQWVLTNLADLTASDVFVIVGNGYAMTNDNGTSSAPAPVAVTISDNEITGTVAANIKWTVSGDATNGYSFSPNGSTDTWLYCNTNANSGSNNNIRVGNGGQYNRIVFELTSDNYLVTKDDYVDRYLSQYVNNGTVQDWRGYINTSNNAVAISFYKKVTGGVLPPSITADNVSIEYNAVSGSIAYTITNGVEGGALTASTTDEWVSIGTVGNNVPFTCSVNEAGTERTATVTLTYTYNRATVTKNVTITQAGNPNATLMTIAEVRAQGTGSVVTTGIVTSCVGTTGYIQDATAAICVYGAELTIGDEIRVSGTLSTYHGLLEITSPQVTVVSSGNTVTPIVKTIAEINADDYTSGSSIQGLYITIENATVTVINGQNTTIAQGDNTIVVRGISSDVTYALNDILTLDGNIGCFDAAQIANPQNVTVQANTDPTITVNPAIINAPAEGENGTLTVTYENFTPSVINVYFCNAEGDAATYDWIVAEINDDDDVDYIISSNESADRTAYLKVYDSNTNTYSNLVTINQEAAPTVATLPFTYDGNGLGELPDGLTQHGLTDKYDNSPKMKFDDTGDWLLLQFNERPGTLTFDIKGNGFSGGTFNVQTSEDGETYTDLATYTELGATQSKEFPNLGENVRYIKWIYTEKVSGNVGLGNIVLNAYTEPVPTISLDEYVIEMVAEGGEGTIDATYENIDVELYSYRLGVEACTEYGETTTYDWITAEMDADYNVHYVVEANQGDARTAYFKVFYDEGMVGAEEWKDGGSVISGGDIYYSDLVTISQAAYVAPSTTGTIMFGNNEGRTPINAVSVTGNDSMGNSWTITTIGTTSFTQHGDYSQVGSRSNPATSITFTTTLPEAMTITSFEARFSGYSGTAGTINLLVDEQNVGTGSLNGSEEITVENTISAMGTVLTVTVTDIERGVNCYYISYTIGTNITVTQTIELTAGWNWVSTYIDMNEIDGMAMLMTALGDNATQIATFDDSAEYFEGEWYWGGDGEHQLTNSNMVMVEVPEDCTVTLEGPAVTRTVEITINQGWNWIGFPFDTEMSFSDAMAGFNAENEDTFASSFDSNEYFEGTWYNNFETLVPGQGYMYYYNGTEPQTLVYQIGDSKARRIVATTPGQFKKLIEQQQ